MVYAKVYGEGEVAKKLKERVKMRAWGYENWERERGEN